MKESVLLLHGLWMNRYAMHALGHRLGEAGFDATAITYHSMRDTVEDHVAAVEHKLAAMRSGPDAPARIHIVGHSMGGVVALKVLERLRDAAIAERLGRVVLLGSPVAGCESGAAATRMLAVRWLLGRSADLWQSGYRLHIPAGFPVGSIAGTRPLGLAMALVALTGANDGVVKVDETRLPGLADHLVLPVSHTGMLISRSVARQCTNFLRYGRFSRA